jgi:hypothetical protein
VHWGTFSLALHAWDEPAETLLAHADARGVPLLMPRLGEAVEPAQRGPVEAWWRSGRGAAVAPAVAPVAVTTAAVEPSNRLARDLPWPLD